MVPRPTRSWAGSAALRQHLRLVVAGDIGAAIQDPGIALDHQLLSGCREDVPRKVNGVWKVSRRTIGLDANVLLDKDLSVFL